MQGAAKEEGNGGIVGEEKEMIDMVIEGGVDEVMDNDHEIVKGRSFYDIDKGKQENYPLITTGEMKNPQSFNSISKCENIDIITMEDKSLKMVILNENKTEIDIINDGMETETTKKNKRKKSVRIFSPFPTAISKLSHTDEFTKNNSLNNDINIDFNYQATNASLTKISWLQKPKEIFLELLRLKMGKIYLKKYLDLYGNVLIVSNKKIIFDSIRTFP